MKNQDETIRYVVYDKTTKEPLRQGGCTRKFFKDIPLEPTERAKILKDRSKKLNLKRYDCVFGTCTHDKRDNGLCERMQDKSSLDLAYLRHEHTADDTINIDNVEEEV